MSRILAQRPKPESGSVRDDGAAAELSQTAKEGHRLYHDYCNQSVIYVIRPHGDPAQKMVTANDLIATMAAGKNGWHEVSMQEASRLADQGKVVVGGLAEPGHGHVVIVIPGPVKPAGDFEAPGGNRSPYGS